MLEVQVKSGALELSGEIQEYVDERLAKLDRFYDQILTARVTIDAPTGHHRQGGPFSVQVELDVPNDFISVTRQKADDLHVAIRSSFDAAERQLEDYVRLRRGDVKAHEEPLRGRVARVFADAGYGFIESSEGREVYFHERAVQQGRFAELRPGDVVTFGEEPGEEGPQANFVAPE